MVCLQQSCADTNELEDSSCVQSNKQHSIMSRKLKAIALKQWQQVKNFDRLKKVYAEMQESKQLANVMKATRQEVRELINVDQVLMYLYDEDSGYLFAQLSDGANPGTCAERKGYCR